MKTLCNDQWPFGLLTPNPFSWDYWRQTILSANERHVHYLRNSSLWHFSSKKSPFDITNSKMGWDLYLHRFWTYWEPKNADDYRRCDEDCLKSQGILRKNRFCVYNFHKVKEKEIAKSKSLYTDISWLYHWIQPNLILVVHLYCHQMR